eukprot:TRINITY_DN46343_c0_g2_i1.p1 TRINITY_DN46343_c0_g2~~TRINITY_DN46343_c0_g2_i1.p1  ORF type:complete len:418 (+),score=103.69 TRINITY_DN46343_c0_g2_i1:207-1460(+)
MISPAANQSTGPRPRSACRVQNRPLSRSRTTPPCASQRGAGQARPVGASPGAPVTGSVSLSPRTGHTQQERPLSPQNRRPPSACKYQAQSGLPAQVVPVQYQANSTSIKGFPGGRAGLAWEQSMSENSSRRLGRRQSARPRYASSFSPATYSRASSQNRGQPAGLALRLQSRPVARSWANPPLVSNLFSGPWSMPLPEGPVLMAHNQLQCLSVHNSTWLEAAGQERGPMTFLSVRAPYLILGLLCLAGLVACSAQDPVSPKAAKFKKMIRDDLNRAEGHLPPPYDEANRKTLEQGLLRLFQEAAQRGQPLMYGVAVLTDQGRVLAARAPDPGHPEGIPREKDGLDYSRYDGVRKLLDNHQAGSFVFYGPEGKLYAVCRPIKHSENKGGGLCVAFPAELITKKLGISEKDFQSLDFNS